MQHINIFSWETVALGLPVHPPLAALHGENREQFCSSESCKAGKSSQQRTTSFQNCTTPKLPPYYLCLEPSVCWRVVTPSQHHCTTERQQEQIWTLSESMNMWREEREHGLVFTSAEVLVPAVGSKIILLWKTVKSVLEESQITIPNKTPSTSSTLWIHS